MNRLKSVQACLTFLAILTFATGCQTDNSTYQDIQNTRAGRSIYEDLKKSCGVELTAFCENVEPGEGRIASCLYGQHSKLSESCNQGLIDANARVESFGDGIGYASTQCADDIRVHCASIIPGEGRMLSCLVDEKRDVVSKRCSQAIKETGLDLEYLETRH